MSKKGTMFYPCLITNLCKRNGMQLENIDKITTNKGMAENSRLCTSIETGACYQCRANSRWSRIGGKRISTNARRRAWVNGP